MLAFCSVALISFATVVILHIEGSANMVVDTQTNRVSNSKLHRLISHPMARLWRSAPAVCLGAVFVLAACTAPEETQDQTGEAAQDDSTETRVATPEAEPASMPQSEAEAPTFSRSVEINAAASDVWAMIGPFCSIQDWHPVVGSCAVDGNTPPTRTLVTVDGTATFVEQETMRDDAAHTYSYAILSGPLPVSDYVGTISVEEASPGVSTITWSSVYTAAEGHEDDASGALTGIYDSGLAAIATSLTD
jgi:hypothetical protein